jgi:hypothetical protein
MQLNVMASNYIDKPKQQQKSKVVGVSFHLVLVPFFIVAQVT